MNDLSVHFTLDDLEKSQIDFGVANGQFSNDLYQIIPCTIAYTYVRFEVDGSIKPCCVAPMKFGNINEEKFDEVWHSQGYYAWRNKFLRIQKSRFHLKDTEYSFCQICPHIAINLESSRLLAIKRD
jgi:radical SAM protein with 4Fe4S-binding SPASM domain